MTLVWGGCLGLGILLILSRWWWPAGSGSRLSRESRAARLLSEAGYASVPPRVLVVVMVLGGLVAGAVAMLLLGAGVLVVGAAAIGGAAPVFWLRARRARLLRSRRAMWPDVCDLLIASVRAGMSLPDALAALAHSAPPPLRPAFARFGRDYAASGHFDSSARRLKLAVADPVGDRIIETLRMARQVGGAQIGTVLRALSASVRAEATVRAEVESRQSWVRGAAVLGVVAPWVILVLLSLRPEGARAYSAPDGILVVAVGGVVSVVAYRLMVRLGQLPEPRRWFA
ncbi:type II secretion system F family protein [Microbacterium sp. LRZ72]|uniref:type II secretion system F family protein n=1 Tax=Microbacterium sp. LRZ72 TaxID=2942481 RepID=UPI0029A372A2|nr:type II secretion system F family protein [Microbacterium sp. LRZ72]MDX2377909.1 type II secretion system F family protein [Microbacterium sp. LRZ72]